jgi:Leucine-rich repeat (LRR) protein
MFTRPNVDRQSVPSQSNDILHFAYAASVQPNDFTKDGIENLLARYEQEARDPKEQRKEAAEHLSCYVNKDDPASRKRLRLSGLHLTTLPDVAEWFSEPEVLDISNNNLKRLPPSFTQLASLKYLDISGNRLRSLPSNIGYLKSLENLSAGENAIAALPVEINALTRLESLDLSFNRFSSVPPSIATLSNLRHLGLTGNNLSMLPNSFLKLTRGCEVYLAGNPLIGNEILTLTKKAKSRGVRLVYLDAIPTVID